MTFLGFSVDPHKNNTLFPFGFPRKNPPSNDSTPQALGKKQSLPRERHVVVRTTSLVPEEAGKKVGRGAHDVGVGSQNRFGLPF